MNFTTNGNNYSNGHNINNNKYNNYDNNYNNNDELFRTPKYKKTLNIPEMYPLDQINNHINNIQQDHHDEEEYGNYNNNNDQYDNYDYNINKENHFNSRANNRYSNSHKEDDILTTDSLKNDIDSNQRMKQKGGYSSSSNGNNGNGNYFENDQVKSNQLQENQITNLLETLNKNQKFSSELLIKNVELQKVIVGLESEITRLQDIPHASYKPPNNFQ
ncbi:hypothetical protein DICPUDRAFT_155227 [Dictyostelium purpureum]|uniref:Uncharacterized protein n=1 Tax=Dictyostelium purpureum TaxID=5786 RepID=F0ZTE6_DICPU|nr:uncharacterized protein DICPUDRAFT_155227 [Dictyostelium purpureum]EGC32767.1 hypothetical protein DICPUDRAFT_155227 [Dictyostelium purpureum]|eukprot:XP_003290690.1 hypothetical protein DICPUDRAFT_155227 [Dictyostelium purpureum]